MEVKILLGSAVVFKYLIISPVNSTAKQITVLNGYNQSGAFTA